MPWASAEAHARLEACDDGRFVGCQRSDLYGDELWLTTRRTGSLWLRGEAPVRRKLLSGLGGATFDSHFASSKR